MLQYIITACVFLLLSREVLPQASTDSATNTGTEPLTSTLTGTAVSGEIGVTPHTGAASGVSSAGGGSTVASAGAASSSPHSGATHKIPASTVSATGAGNTNNNNSVIPTSSTASKFKCYQGSCNQTNCHQNETIYGSLKKISCEKEKQCSIQITQNSTEFSCHVGECICGKKVAGQEKLCCTASECNNQKLKCSHSSNLGASLVVLVAVLMSLYLLN